MIGQARTGDAAWHVVAQFQEMLLPAALPVLPRVRIAARYLPAAQPQAAGGDWFDALPLPGGAVALVTGDLARQGVAAAAAMGQLRAVLDERLLADPSLATVLRQVDAYAARHPVLRAATLVLAVLDPLTGALEYATCGHPPPLIIQADGTARFLPGSGGGPLGTGAEPGLAADRLQPGELVLLYSDGLVDRPGRTLADGLAELATVAAAAASRVPRAGTPAAAADRVCQRAVERLTRTGNLDDVTALVAQRLAGPLRPLSLEIPAVVASLPPAREVFRDWLATVDAAPVDGNSVLLAVVEVISNAIEHAYPPGRPGPVSCQAALSDQGILECRIADQGRWRPPANDSGRGHGLLIAQAMVDELRVGHPLQSAGSPEGARGTVVTLRHRPHRPVILASRPGPEAASAVSGPAFRLDTVPGADGPRVRVHGPVDLSTAGQLTLELLSASQGGVRPVTVDLTGVTHLASAGVSALFQARDQLGAHRQPLSLIAARGSAPRAVLDLARLPAADPRGEPSGGEPGSGLTGCGG